MNKEIKYKFNMESGVPYIQSNLISNDLDMLQVISADIGNKKLINECINHIKSNKVWWSNSSKLEYESGFVLVSPAFDWEANAKISKQKLLSILKEFKSFVG